MNEIKEILRPLRDLRHLRQTVDYVELELRDKVRSGKSIEEAIDEIGSSHTDILDSIKREVNDRKLSKSKFDRNR